MSGALTTAPKDTLLTGSVSRPLFRLAWPVIALFLIQYLFEIVDIAWVGQLEDAEVPLAAMSLGAFVSWALNAVIQLIVVGTSTLVAQAIGARNQRRARRVGAQSLAFGIPYGIGLTVLMLLLLEPLLTHLQMPDLVAADARRYLRVIYIGMPWIYWLLCFEAIQRGKGDMLLPMKIGALAFGLNAILDPVLIFGLGPFPAMGVEGAAIASVTAKATGVLIYAVLCRRGRLLVRAEEVGFRFDIGTILTCAKIGTPISILGLLFMGVHIELVKVIAPFGAGAIAALGIGARIEGVTYVIVDALGVATQTMVGQNIGAAKPKRALRAAWIATAWGIAVGLVMTFAMFLIPTILVAALASNASPEAIAECVMYCRIAAICQPFMAAEVVMVGAFAGVGYTVPAMLNSVPITLSRIPISIALISAAGMGSEAIYWTLSGTCIVRGVVSMIWFRSNRWRRKYLWNTRP